MRGNDKNSGYIPVRIENGSAWSFAGDRLIPDGILCKVLTFLQGSVQTSNGNNCLCSFNAGARPGIP
jgi:hypothetical protein